MSTRKRAPNTEVTGVATGSLGTGTALDDTQVYSVDTFATADHPDEAAPEMVAPDPVAPAPVAAPGRVLAAPKGALRLEPAPVAATARPRRIDARRPVTGGYPVGLLAGIVVVLVVVAAVLTFRGGDLAGGTGSGQGLAGGATFPPIPSVSAVETPAPPPSPDGHGHGNGHGHGH